MRGKGCAHTWGAQVTLALDVVGTVGQVIRRFGIAAIVFPFGHLLLALAMQQRAWDRTGAACALKRHPTAAGASADTSRRVRPTHKAR